MTDNTTYRGELHRNSINVHEKQDMEYWTRELGVSEAALVAAVMAAGCAVKSVKYHLGK